MLDTQLAIAFKETSRGAMPSLDRVFACFIPTLLASSLCQAQVRESRSSVGLECIGRLIIKSPTPVAWPSIPPGSDLYKSGASFSENVYHAGDSSLIGNVRIATLNDFDGYRRSQLNDSLPTNIIQSNRAEIKRNRELLLAFKASVPPTTRDEHFVDVRTDRIANLEQQIALIGRTSADVDYGVPGFKGYWSEEPGSRDTQDGYTLFRAFSAQGKHVYIFERATKLTSTITREVAINDFAAFLGKFRPRGPNEIPSEPGFCVPLGFIPDNGETPYDIKQSVRWPEAPGVLYTIHTGTVNEDRQKIATLEALTSVMAADQIDKNDPTIQVTARVGPRDTAIGSWPAAQGGMALELRRKGKKPFEVYNVRTGYSGQADSYDHPFIFVELSTRSREQAPELKTNPPPFKQSYERLEQILKSIRLRPTTAQTK